MLKFGEAVQDSIIKINYIFTISEAMAVKKLFSLSVEKKKLLVEELVRRLK